MFKWIQKWTQSTPITEDQHSKWIPQSIGHGLTTGYELSLHSTQKIQWVSKEKQANGEPLHIRTPSESSKRYSYPGVFRAAGKRYRNWNQLCHKPCNSPDVFTDIYGRTVYFYAQRFPCFDEYDYLYENRWYRWFFILGQATMTRVFYTDEQAHIHVTEDLEYVEVPCWDAMHRTHLWE